MPVARMTAGGACLRTALVLLAALAISTSAFAVDTPASAGPAAAAAPAWPLVREGQQGAQVRTVQHLLRQRGETIVADGIFLGLTKAAVQRFQSANGLSADGIVGPLTWPVLLVPLDTGATGEAVRALQVQLNRYAAGLTVDGVLAGPTAEAVSAFKTERGLGSGSTVDVAVWQWLVGGAPSVGGYALPLSRDVLPRGEYDDPHHDYPAIDLPVPTGTAAYASAAGTVAAVNDSSCGIGVVITDANGVRHIYCHFSQRVAAGGSTVVAGQLVGYTGNTGNSTGPHLHFGIRTGTTNRCPQPFLLALYDGVAPPAPATLPTTGCYYATPSPARPLLDHLH
ncbi:peptidoglycan DD-metalloendopeptidase family protein [Phytohabitans sp. ZYX-F-186]|uniref:Peptidoglycan DD-metalloendopeptidase family protein n=1 Tax=Phytohabitans maris TaxID=3071409 RepID=A0ABU0ZMK7_9ACTN|nr:peptidoglycan-binding protein [Phytohabitans sp. ZYX-F-186]MDQ7908262.1 peptidoglycan DD-metalloendopeptidase family protein [Phytohabitans sp. ZYX-F-186]